MFAIKVIDAGLDKISSPADLLRKELKKIEERYIGEVGPDLTQARICLLDELPRYLATRSHFGRVLYGYKRHFKAVHGWTAAATLIADAIGRDVKTVFRMVADYERVSGLDPLFEQALLDQQVDPAAPKNAEMVAQILAKPEPKTPEAAAEIVTAVVRERRERRKTERLSSKSDKDRKKNGEQQSLEQQAYQASNDPRQTTEAFANSIARLIRHRLLVVPADQRNAETDRIVVLIGRALGRDLVVSRRTLPPPTHAQHSPAA